MGEGIEMTCSLSPVLTEERRMVVQMEKQCLVIC